MTRLSLKKYFKITIHSIPAAIRSKLFKTPFWVHFHLTRKCNFNCAYCNVRDNSKKDIPTKDIKKIIDKLYSLGIRGIAFLGGEPTLRKDFCEILKYSADKGIFTYFTTNGSLLNEDYIRRISKTGVDYIEVSIDSIVGFDGSQKSYEKSKNKLELLVKYQKKYRFGLKTHIALTNKNLDTVIDTIKRVHKHKIPLTVGYICRSVNGKVDDESFFVTSKESKRKLNFVVNQIIRLKRRGVKIMNQYSYLEGIKKFVNNDFKWSCMAGVYSFSVDYDGSVQICTELKPFNVNVLDIDKNFFKNRIKEINKTKSWCTKKCYPTAHNTVAHMVDHPFKSVYIGVK